MSRCKMESITGLFPMAFFLNGCSFFGYAILATDCLMAASDIDFVCSDEML